LNGETKAYIGRDDGYVQQIELAGLVGLQEGVVLVNELERANRRWIWSQEARAQLTRDRWEAGAVTRLHSDL
jgi:hypothetical protein